jgi:acetoin utilization protein AcuB
MIAEEFINDQVPPLKYNDSVDLALRWLDEFKVTYLPVTNDRKYLGMFSEELFIDQEGEPKANVGDYPLMFTDVTVGRHQHLLDVIKLSSEHHLSTIPVIDEEGLYLGLINLSVTDAILSKVTASQEIGGILELSMHEKDYSMSHVSRLIEAEEVKILSSFVEKEQGDPQYIKLTLKLNKPDLSRVIASLERFGYIITAKYHQTELRGNEQERLGLLLKYLSL